MGSVLCHVASTGLSTEYLTMYSIYLVLDWGRRFTAVSEYYYSTHGHLRASHNSQETAGVSTTVFVTWSWVLFTRQHSSKWTHSYSLLYAKRWPIVVTYTEWVSEWVSEWVTECEWVSEWACTSELVSECQWVSEPVSLWISQLVSEWEWLSEWVGQSVSGSVSQSLCHQSIHF